MVPEMKTAIPTIPGQWNRRSFISSSALAAGAFLFDRDRQAQAQTEKETLSLNRFPRMMQEYFVGRVREIERERIARLEGLRTRAEAEAYVEEVRRKIRLGFGPFPEKTPLHPRVTRVLQRDGYRIENVIFESRPRFFVTANLYVPDEENGRSYPLPGVVGTCGHSGNGKAAEAYQSFAQGLARQGYVVLLYDPIGQGERLQYPDDNLESRIGVGVHEHLYAGNQQFLVGEFFGTWRVWDGIRALDYLLTREEVDSRRLGVTGNSGGGTMTTWLCGLDQRYTMAAPSCFVTSFRRNLENELPADTEQCPPRALALGLDHEDFLAAMAPKPVIILAKERDYFDVRGSEAALERLKHLYRLLGAEENIALFAGPTGHGYSRENREAMYRWFNGAADMAGSDGEPVIDLEKDETLHCAPDGQVVRLDSRPVFGFTAERAVALKEQRGEVGGERLASAVKRFFPVAVPASAPDYRILRSRSGRGYPAPHFTTYAIETEPGVHAVVYLLGEQRHESRPPRDKRQALLYVSHLSSDVELREESLLRQYYEENAEAAFYTCDVRGSGDSQPDTCGADSFLQPYGSDYFYAIHALMLDDPYPVQRVRDLSRVVRWLTSQGHEEIHLIGNGRGTVPGAIAAFLADPITQVTLKDALPSFHEVATSETYDWPLSSFLPGVLEHFDLPDVYRDLESRKRLQRL